jgi:hypothetical protein
VSERQICKNYISALSFSKIKHDMYITVFISLKIRHTTKTAVPADSLNPTLGACDAEI